MISNVPIEFYWTTNTGIRSTNQNKYVRTSSALSPLRKTRSDRLKFDPLNSWFSKHRTSRGRAIRKSQSKSEGWPARGELKQQLKWPRRACWGQEVNKGIIKYSSNSKLRSNVATDQRSGPIAMLDRNERRSNVTPQYETRVADVGERNSGPVVFVYRTTKLTYLWTYNRNGENRL